MALPQSVDPTTLNLTGKPAIATGPTTITSEATTGMPNPTVAQEKSNVSPLLGALFGAGLGYKASMANQGNASANASNANQPGKVNIPTIPKIPGGSTGSGTIGTPGGTATGGGSTGSTPSISFPAGTTQAQIDAQYGKTNGQSNYVIVGPNMSNGSVVARPNTMIPGYTSTGTGAGPSDTATPDGTQDAGTYFQDSYGNIYNPSGNLYAVNSGGTYYVASDNGMWTNVNTGDQLTSDQFYGGGTSDGYTSGGYDNNADYTDITGGGSYADGSIFDNSPIDTGTYIKNGGLVTMMKRGGGVKGYAEGSLIEAATAMAPSSALGSTPVAMASATPNTNSTTPPATDSTSIIDSVLGFAKANPMLSGAALGGLLTQLINSNSSYSVNKGVDMSALGSLKPRTTPAGPAKFVPYSQYGTPTSPADYSSLYQNLGVSPFNDGSADQTAPDAARSSMPAMSTPTTPTGGLPTAPTSPVVTPPATTTPTYYSDADGNIYDANGDLVYDTTTSSVTGPSSSPIPSFASTSTEPSSGLAVPSLPTTTATDASYSYGTPVTPASILGSKKGGLARQAATAIDMKEKGIKPENMAEGGALGYDNLNIPHEVGGLPTPAEMTGQDVPMVNGRKDYRNGNYVEGPGDGQSDDIPAMLADGEYVIDAETVAQLGNGSNKAGAKALDTFRQNIRAHKRNTPHDKIPPKSKSPLAYLKGAK